MRCYHEWKHDDCPNCEGKERTVMAPEAKERITRHTPYHSYKCECGSIFGGDDLANVTDRYSRHQGNCITHLTARIVALEAKNVQLQSQVNALLMQKSSSKMLSQPVNQGIQGQGFNQGILYPSQFKPEYTGLADWSKWWSVNGYSTTSNSSTLAPPLWISNV